MSAAASWAATIGERRRGRQPRGRPGGGRLGCAGDRIAAIDGVAASTLTNAVLRDRLKAAPGTIVTFTIDSTAGRREVALTLADLI